MVCAAVTTKVGAVAGGRRGRQGDDVVGGLLRVPGHAKIEAALEEGEVQTDLKLVDVHVLEVLISRRSVGGRTPSGAELTEIEPGGQALGEGVGEDPREVHGRIEHAVAVVRQGREPVVTPGNVEEELVSPAYVGREIERVDRAPRQHGVEWWPQ